MTNTTIPVDLHCHSLHSDGEHTIEVVLDLVKQNGGKYIALTDHDTVDGIKTAREYASKTGLHFIAGVEISVTWQNSLIHILGLNIDEHNSELVHLLQQLRANRYTRGQKIAAKLEELGITGALEGALSYCANPNALSRTHFARFLVENGYAKANRVFDKFLTKGKPAYVEQQWATLAQAVSSIKQSGGIAVIAHPARYKLTKLKLQQLINEFKSYGGEGIEVISSSHNAKLVSEMALVAQKNNLYASIGSDFHRTHGYPRVTVGVNQSLPNICTPIFTQLGITL